MTDRWMEEAERLRELVEPLLDAFYAQGKEGRNHDDEAGSAQTADDALMAGIRAALSAAHQAGRLEERARSIPMHRRAQKAEGKLMRMEAAHADACEYAFRNNIDYAMYGSLLLNMNQSLFPKLPATPTYAPNE